MAHTQHSSRGKPGPHLDPPPPPPPRRAGSSTTVMQSILFLGQDRADPSHALQAAALSQPEDPPEYAHGLLHATYVVVHPASPPLRTDMSLRQEFTQAEVILLPDTSHTSPACAPSNPLGVKLSICSMHLRSRSWRKHGVLPATAGRDAGHRLDGPPHRPRRHQCPLLRLQEGRGC